MSDKYLTSITLPNGDKANVGIPIFSSMNVFKNWASSGQIGMVGRFEEHNYISEATFKGFTSDMAHNPNNYTKGVDYDYFEYISINPYHNAPTEDCTLAIYLQMSALHNFVNCPKERISTLICEAKDGVETVTFYHPDYSLSDYDRWGTTEDGLPVFKVELTDYTGVSVLNEKLEELGRLVARIPNFGAVFDDGETFDKAKNINLCGICFCKFPVPFKFYQKKDGYYDFAPIPLISIVADTEGNLPTDTPYEIPLGTRGTVYDEATDTATDYRLLKDGWVKDTIDTTAIDAKIQANTDSIESLSDKIPTTIVNSYEELLELNSPIGSVVNVVTDTIKYDKKTINPVEASEVAEHYDATMYANPIESFHYTSFNRIEAIAGGYGSSIEWEVIIYFSDVKQSTWYNIHQTDFAKPVPTLIIKKTRTNVYATFFDPELTLEDYGEYGVTDGDNIYAEMYFAHDSGAALFLTELIQSRNYKTGFVFNDGQFAFFTYDTGDYINFIKDGPIITSYIRSKKENGEEYWEVVPDLKTIKLVQEDNNRDISNITSIINKSSSNINNLSTKVDNLSTKVDDFMPADYLIQMAQNDGRLMCHDEFMGNVDIMTSPESYTTFLTRGGGCVMTQPIQAVWSTYKQPASYQSMFGSYNYIDVIYSLPAPYYADDGTVDASGLFAGLTNLKKIDSAILDCYKSKITGTRRMFYNCTKLRPLVLYGDFPKLEYVSDMFYNACTVNSGYDKDAYIKIVGNFDALQNATRMFDSCAPMSIDLSQANMPMVETADRMFYNVNTYGNPATIALPTTMPKIVSMYEMFYNSYVNTISSGLQTCQNVTSTADAFKGCSSLTNLPTGFLGGLKISVSFASSSNLTRESILNVINAVADLSAEGKTATLTLHATAKARLTTDDIAIATAKGWTIA